MLCPSATPILKRFFRTNHVFKQRKSVITQEVFGKEPQLRKA